MQGAGFRPAPSFVLFSAYLLSSNTACIARRRLSDYYLDSAKGGTPVKNTGSHKQQKLLVIGTQPALVVLLRTMLSVGKVHVLATDEPEAAIRLVDSARGQIALALIDVCTVETEPRMIADSLRAIQPGIAILFFSSLVDGEVIRLGIIDSERGVLRQEGVLRAIEDALQTTEPPVKPQRKKRLKTLTAGKLFDSLAM